MSTEISSQKQTRLRECNQWKQLPESLVMHILSRLPSKTLINCMCVCKEWLSTVSDYQFSRLQLRSPLHILFQPGYPLEDNKKFKLAQIGGSSSDFNKVEKVEFSNLENSLPDCGFCLTNSCNGLILLSGYEKLFVCNPISGEFITIPPPYDRDGSRVRGLGFSVRTNEYKVLHTYSPEFKDDVREAEICTIGSGVWRSIGCIQSTKVNSEDALLHGALHWISSCEFISCVSFETEMFGELASPRGLEQMHKLYPNSLNLGVLGGCLSLSVFHYDYSKFDMWVMMDYGVQESWMKILAVNNFSCAGESYYLYTPVAVLSNGEEVLMMGGGTLVCYNRKTKNFREIGSIEAGTNYYYSIVYSPFLVEVDLSVPPFNFSS